MGGRGNELWKQGREYKEKKISASYICIIVLEDKGKKTWARCRIKTRNFAPPYQWEESVTIPQECARLETLAETRATKPPRLGSRGIVNVNVCGRSLW